MLSWVPAGTDSDSVKGYNFKKKKLIKDGLLLETMNEEFIEHVTHDDPSKEMLEKELVQQATESKNIV